MSKQIQLTKGYSVVVDDEDYDWLMKYNWHVHDTNLYTRYAQAWINGKHVKMHRLILQYHGLLEGSKQVDHIDRNGLNNQKNNLRACTHAENMMNRRGAFKNGYLGICKIKRKKNPWKAQIGVNGRRIYLGYFPTREQAAHAYDEAARKYHGEFATLNFPGKIL